MKEEILEFFREHIDSIEGSGGSGSNFALPPFQLTARDFIAFAEADLEGQLNNHKLVNVTSNLKRAADCTLDYLMSVLHLDDFYRKKRLGVDRKLGFFKKAGIFNSRSLEKLNRIRNRLEHHYEIPDVKEVDVYFDLVVAFVALGEGFLPIIAGMSEIDLILNDNGEEKYFGSKIDISNPSICLELPSNGNSKEYSINLSNISKSKAEDLDSFAYLLRVHILLFHLYNGTTSSERFIQDLSKDF